MNGALIQLPDGIRAWQRLSFVNYACLKEISLNITLTRDMQTFATLSRVELTIKHLIRSIPTGLLQLKLKIAFTPWFTRLEIVQIIGGFSWRSIGRRLSQKEGPIQLDICIKGRHAHDVWDDNFSNVKQVVQRSLANAGWTGTLLHSCSLLIMF